MGSIRRIAAAGLLGLVSLPLGAQTLTVAPANDDLSESLRASALSLTPDDAATPADIVAVAKGDYQRLLGALYGAGYFGASISIKVAGREATGLSVLSPPARAAPVDIRIALGPRFRFGRAEISPLPQGATPPDSFAPGAPASTAAIRAAAEAGVTAWRNASHAKADLADQSITARHPDQALDVALRISPGPALRFGRLMTPTDTAVRESRLRAIAGLPTGQPYSPDTLRRVRERLVSTGTFRSVVLEEAEVANPDGTLDIALDVEDAPPRRLGFGAELSSSEGLGLQAFWMHRNAFGGAEQLRFDLDIAGIDGEEGGEDYTLGTSLVIPGFRRPDDTLTLSAQVQSVDQSTYDGELFEIGVRRERRFDAQRTAALGVGFRFSDMNSAFGSHRYRHLMLEARAIWDKRDDKLAPRTGVYADLHAQPFIGLAGSASGVRSTADLRAYRGLGERMVLAGRLQFGAITGAALNETPPALLFLSGGGGSVRGQSFQSLGVETDTGRAGGRSFVGLSAELRQGVTDALSVVGFFDLGLIGGGSDFGDLNDHAGFGLGARYSTGFGPIRVDLGLPSDDIRLEKLQLYIGLGEAF